MANYSKVNLKDIENSAKSAGYEARFARKFLDSQELGVSLFSFEPNIKSSRAHKHKVQEEAYVVVKGSGQILLDDQVEDLKTMDVIRVAPEVVRAFAAGPEGLDIIAIGGNKPEEGDGEMMDANWP